MERIERKTEMKNPATTTVMDVIEAAIATSTRIQNNNGRNREQEREKPTVTVTKELVKFACKRCRSRKINKIIH